MSARKKKAATKKSTLAVGDVIERKFKDRTIKLTVAEDGFRVGKKTYASLTAAAKAVTKYASISGPRFWLGAAGGDA